jgi:GDP-4-dehydro-6-deoxy-D-mannose reductase
MRVLVTGAAGFSGTRMMEFLAAQRGVTPVGLVHRHSGKTGKTPYSFVTADLLDPDALHDAAATADPDAVIHLAGLTHGTTDALHTTNVTGTRNLLDACLTANPNCRILVISSSAVYGYAGDMPIPETAPLHPISEYGKSKVAQEELSLNYGNGDGDIAVARPFNLAGPHQPEQFVCGRIVSQAIEIERNKRKSLELWETTSARDLIDVRDVVRGYWALVSRPDFTGECAARPFNLGSGNAYPVSEIIAMIEEITGDHYLIRLPETPQKIPIPSQRSDNTRITGLTGWQPEIPLEKTLRDMLAAARGEQAD